MTNEINRTLIVDSHDVMLSKEHYFELTSKIEKLKKENEELEKENEKFRSNK